MIVEKLIMLKIDGVSFRLIPGKAIPQNVIDYLTETKQLDELKKQGAISEEKKSYNKSYAKKEEEKEVESI